MEDIFKWESPIPIGDYSLTTSHAGDLVCEKSIYYSCIREGKIPSYEHLYIVDRNNKMLSLYSNELIDFDDREYVRIAGVMLTENNNE